MAVVKKDYLPKNWHDQTTTENKRFVSVSRKLQHFDLIQLVVSLQNSTANVNYFLGQLFNVREKYLVHLPCE